MGSRGIQVKAQCHHYSLAGRLELRGKELPALPSGADRHWMGEWRRAHKSPADWGATFHDLTHVALEHVCDCQLVSHTWLSSFLQTEFYICLFPWLSWRDVYHLLFLTGPERGYRLCLQKDYKCLWLFTPNKKRQKKEKKNITRACYSTCFFLFYFILCF